ncbi:MAG TPA: DinB family protein [Bryobacteraceae bacterium]|nr:DinB family protein [Bryobacteraceae bacterium]
MRTLLILCAAAALQAQNNPLSADLKQNYAMQKQLLLAAAERMPAADYAFKAAPSTGTFAARVAHVADAQFMICGAVKGEAQKPVAASKTSKADILSALKGSFDYCDGVYNGMTDATSTQPVKIFGESQSKLSALWGNLGHDQEIYGYIAVYLRLKGLTPPSSDRQPPK